MTRNLDDLIDAVAREMTGAPSPVDLRARVMNEIAQVDEAKASFHRWKWLAAAAGIVLVSYLLWPERQPEAPSNSRAPSVASVRVEPSPPPVPSAVAPESDRSRAARSRATSRAPEETVVAIPALAEPPALDIAPLDAATTALPRLTVASLEVADLDIKPLTPPQ